MRIVYTSLVFGIWTYSESTETISGYMAGRFSRSAIKKNYGHEMKIMPVEFEFFLNVT